MATAPFCRAQTIYEQAVNDIQNGKAATAIRTLGSRLHEAPQDLRALTLMGMALSAQGRLEEANRYYRRALDSKPDFAPALKNLAVNEMATGDTEIARARFERVLEMTPADPGVRLGLAQASVDTGKTERAVYVLEHMPAESPALAHFAAGEFLARLQRFASAAHEFELARNGYPKPYDVEFNLMLAELKAGQPARAVQIGEQLVSQGNRQAELYNLLAQAYEAAGKTGEAYNALRTATQVDPADPANYLDLIALCLTHKNFDLALEIADVGISRLPKSDSVHLQRGIVLAMKNEFQAATAEFESAIRIAPQRSVPHVARALMLLQVDRPAEAVTVLRERARTEPDYLSLWFLGEALSRAGAETGSDEEREAVDALSRSVQINADVAAPRILLAKLLARRGELDRAEAHLTRALALEPDNITATYQLAQVCQRKGDTARARELFAKVSKAKAEDREQFTRGGLQRLIQAGSR
jgi:Flp pilus assembly protein TadD